MIVDLKAEFFQEQDTVKQDTLKPYESSERPTFIPTYRFGDPFSNRSSRSPLFLRDPSQLDLNVRFNPDSTADDAGVTYSVFENIGDLDFRPATFMTFDEYDQYTNSQLNKDYFQEKSEGLDGESAVSSRSLIPRLYISPVFDRIFGGSYVDIQPNGFVNLDFGGRYQRIDNPSIPRRQQRNGNFNFDQQISMNVVGRVGEKLAVTFNFDNNNTFDFQNNLKVEYTGYEEEIIKRIEIGNVSMPVQNSLISGAQSLFGIKSELQFGKLFVTTILSQQRGRNETLTIENGFQGREFEIQASNYDENRHFFLGHFFRDNYENWLRTLPDVNSGLNISRVEVYVLNRTNETAATRNIVALLDLGETDRISNAAVTASANIEETSNNANSLNNIFFSAGTVLDRNGIEAYIEDNISSFENSVDYVAVNTARQLDETEFTLNAELGYISLNRALQSDELLAVSFDYTINGQRFKVGELTEDYQNRSDEEVIYLKMLRPNTINTTIPTWDLMMKNIYNLNAAQVSEEGFELRVHYRDDASGLDNPSLQVGQRLTNVPLVEIFQLDRLNIAGDRQPDGNFDFIDGRTISTRNGNIIFPVLEPFGRTLNSFFNDNETNLRAQYVYDELYSETKVNAALNASKDKFVILGRLTAGSASEIALPGINIAQGSVSVTAGGALLTEGQDYRVDYNLGRVTILNDGILSSGKTLNVSYEKADLFNFQTRTLAGARFDYRFNDNFNIGATILHLNEQPGGISRFAVGNEPNSNTKYGLDINFQQESRFLTKMVDALPLVSTKEPSQVTFNAEIAQIRPGTSNEVNGEGTSYIDDFENAVTPINIGGWQSWNLAATPESRFSEATSSGLDNSFRRAKLAWYTVDNTIFYQSNSNLRPDNINETVLSNNYERAYLPQEIFPQRDNQQVVVNVPLLDIAYYPSERGQYNYNPSSFYDPTSERDFLENDPKENWGGITRAILNETNFDVTNIEYLEFWMLDPFLDDPVNDGVTNVANSTGGQLYINLGDISEDVLADNRHAYENGLPSDGTLEEVSKWGQITNDQFLTNFFENSPGARDNQDVGLDGLSGDREQLILDANLNPEVMGFDVQQGRDISADDFRYFLDPSYDQRNATIVERYRDWNGMEGNSPIASENDQRFVPASTTLPDNEDLNQDNTVSNVENYFEYRVDLKPNALDDSPFVVDAINGLNDARWYLFRVPLGDFVRTEGSPTRETIKYIRLYLTGWSEPVILRTANMRMVGSQWRKFEGSLNEPGLNEISNPSVSNFDISVVSIEENSTENANGSRYVVPPGLSRDIDNTTPQNVRVNEQSLQLCVEDLTDGDSRAVFKNVSYDLINYGRIKMFFHAESVRDQPRLLDDEMTAYIRLGTDFTENYYEVEVPLKVTPAELSGRPEDIARAVWPLENEIDISINELLGTKSQRNRSNLREDLPFQTRSNDDRYQITVAGRPDLSAVRVLMIGVRNPRIEGADTSPKSGCIWANELRVTDFDTRAGWAANARAQIKLADLAVISASTNYTSIGFGGIQQRISERTRAETTQYDITANINLDRFLRPDKTGLSIPMFASYESTVITPQFDPLDPDVPLEASLEAFDTPEERNRYRRIVEDRTTTRSLNFTNVRKNKVNPDARKPVFDIANFSFNYAYSDRTTSNVSTQLLLNKTTSGGINYNYTPITVTFAPFENSERLSSPYLALIKDFNFSPLPSNFSFSSNLRRQFTQRQFYNSDLTIDGVDPLFERLFTFVRNYDFRWDFTKSLGLVYSATANAVIDEPSTAIEGDIDSGAERRFIWNEIKDMGRMKNFSQNITLNYSVPLDKFPFTDWISLDAQYAVGYNWIAGALERGNGNGQLISNNQDTVDLFFGNIISNQRTIGFNPRLDIDKLYSKMTLLKNAKDNAGPDANFGTKFLNFLMMTKSINGSYSINERTELPGFDRNPFLLGLDEGFGAPGYEFILGSQDPDIRFRAAENDWLVDNPNLNSQFQQTYNTDLNVQADLRPIDDLSIQLTWNQGITNNYQELFRWDEDLERFRSLTPVRSGGYSTSFVTISTAFERSGSNNFSQAFSRFERNLPILRNRVNSRIENADYKEEISQDILIPAFLAAYSGQDASEVALTPVPKIPLPNWRFDYSGLNKLGSLSDIFQSFSISHAYNSTYNVSNYTSSGNITDTNLLSLRNSILDYPVGAARFDATTEELAPVYIINQVVISEQFVPLIGINFTTTNNISSRMEFRKTRNLALNMANAQVTETSNNEFSLTFGYTKAGFKFPFRFQGRTITLKNDLTINVAGSIRNTRTIQRRINDGSSLTNGDRNFQIRPTVAYRINQQLDFTFYFERNVNNPILLDSFPRRTTAFGFQLRFNIAQ
ncbi:MAG: cell surface protein SprA [Bacteroidota bacterium]